MILLSADLVCMEDYHYGFACAVIMMGHDCFKELKNASSCPSYYEKVFLKPMKTYSCEHQNYLKKIFEKAFGSHGGEVAGIVLKFAGKPCVEQLKFSYSLKNVVVLHKERQKVLREGNEYIPSTSFYKKGVSDTIYLDAVESREQVQFSESFESKFMGGIGDFFVQGCVALLFVKSLHKMGI
jgi:hypothetical protein